MFELLKRCAPKYKPLQEPTALNVHKDSIYIGNCDGRIFSTIKDDYLDIDLGSQIFVLDNYKDLIAAATKSKVFLFDQLTGEIKNICSFETRFVCTSIQLMNENFIVHGLRSRTLTSSTTFFSFVKEEQSLEYSFIEAPVGSDAFLANGNELLLITSEATGLIIRDIVDEHKVVWSIDANVGEFFIILSSFNSRQIVCTIANKDAKLLVVICRNTKKIQLIHTYKYKSVVSYTKPTST
jgi:hypothetical protein